MSEKGMALISTFLVMTTLLLIIIGFLYLTSTQTVASGSDIVSSKAVWLAEAGLEKAIWNLKTPAGSGGQGENWTTTGMTESLGDGSYTMVVARYDFALAANGSSATASSSNGTNVPANALDGDGTTYWQSATKPTPDEPDKPPQEIVIAFPYSLTINKARFLVPAGSDQQAPKDYTWEVSTDGTSYTIVVSVKNNNSLDVTDTFVAASQVNYLKLRVTKINGGSIGVRIATLEAIGSKITSTGTVAGFNRKVEQTVVADDGSPENQVAYDEIDWNEIVPA